jgi:DNA (cytosine-5)-methyltransferase 1
MSTNPHAWNLADLASVPRNGVRVMTTFSCGGGSSMGYKLAGCDVVAANDIDPEMAWHYQRNLAPKHYFLCPIRDLLTAELPAELHDLDILDGSPPCSTFSMIGSREKAWGKDKFFREGQAKQVLSDLFFDYLDLVARLRPKVAIAENVKGMTSGNARGYAKLVMARFREIGYRPQLFLVNAADCGVPQRRERVFFCAVRDDITAPSLALAPAHRWVSTKQACAGLAPMTDAERLDTVPDNATLKYWATSKGTDYGKACERATGTRAFFSFSRLDADKPSLTLIANHTSINHWDECRQLTFREWKRLGSFPDDYHAKTDKIGKYMIGMSVPPRMTEQVARAVCSQWLGVSARSQDIAA